MHNAMLSMLQSSTTHWYVTRREKVNVLYLCGFKRFTTQGKIPNFTLVIFLRQCHFVLLPRRELIEFLSIVINITLKFNHLKTGDCFDNIIVCRVISKKSAI